MPPSQQQQQQRVVAHFDLDAFYVGCERELNPTALLGRPVAVSQYNPYGTLRETSASEIDRRLIVQPGKRAAESNPDANGSLIAVSYEARAAGVKRNDRGKDAVAKCPALRIVQVPVRHGKADLSMYRDASYRVLKKLVRSIKEHSMSSKAAADKMKVEKASIDEIYMDLSSVAGEMAARVMEERDGLRQQKKAGVKRPRPDDDGNADVEEKPSSRYWEDTLASFGAPSCTTIGGVEEVSAAGLAANALSKDELRRGSAAQVADSAAEALDPGSQSWWRRPLAEWTDLEIALACGAGLAAKARSDVAKHFMALAEDGTEGETFTLSAGVSTNKTLSKLASGMKKPNRQTLINPEHDAALQKLFHPLPIGRIRGLGGKFGAEVAEKLGVATVGDVARLPLVEIERHYPPSPDDATARFLFDISRGKCTEEVDDRTLAKSIGCGKTFRNHLALDSSNESEIRKWAGELCGELTERLQVDRRDNLRTPKLFGVTVHVGGPSWEPKTRSTSKSTAAPRAYERYTETATKLVRQIVGSSEGKIEGLTVFVSSFVEVADESSSIIAAFGRVTKPRDEGMSQSAASKAIQKKKERRGSLKTLWSSQNIAHEHAPMEDISHDDNVQSLARTTTPEKKERKGLLKTLWSQSENVNKKANGSIEQAEGAASGTCGSADLLAGDDDIDPDVFSQLPPSIQAEIRQSRSAAARGNAGVDEKKNGMNSWLSQTAEDPKPNIATKNAADSAVAAAKSIALPQASDIDQATLAELPPDIREAVLRDIAASSQTLQGGKQNQVNKRTRIDTFFRPSSRK